MRVCLDTNVFVAAFATRGLCADVVRAVLPEHDLVIGEVILAELRRTLATKFRVPADRIEAVESVLTAFRVIPKPAEPSPVAIRDASDRWVLATAVAGEADILVTGDKDLLDARNESTVRILDPRSFWELLRSARPR